MNKNYQAGRRFEYELKAVWEERGYSVVRASGSHGLYDLVAFRPDRKVELVQAKRVSTEADGKRLVEEFIETTVPSKFFHQTIAFKVKGNSQIHTRTV